MATAFLEHVNVTVSDPQKTAKLLCDLFGWHIRWQGDSIDGGKTIHVGEEKSYVAVYTNPKAQSDASVSYYTKGGLNHIAMVVDDLDATEKKVLAQGFETVNHGDYEPGRRFYFHDHDGIEYEIVSYDCGCS